jgi:prepilin-type N-terminal cleavage/methylation domain-containing protein/prepilin-type processing-associated H-X9-DG protein
MKRASFHSCGPKLGNRGLRREAFTLIELLVVAAVIGLLATMLLPVLAKARSATQGVQCLSNSRQLVLGWLLYADDHDGRLAPNTMQRMGGWASGSMTYEGLHPDNTNSAFLVDPAFAKLGPYISDARIARCPSDQSRLRMGDGQRLLRVRSFSMNLAVGLQSMDMWPSQNLQWRVYKTASQITKPVPSELWVFVDEHPDSIDDVSFTMHLNRRGTPNYFYSWPANFHGKGASFAFADGHAERHRWVDSRTLHDNLYCGCLSSYARQGYFTPCPGNPDLAWLQERTSSPIDE